MSEEKAPTPPIIKKIKKGGHGHHGGAWKVAFADFAVAMMAFFLVLWITANTTTEEKQQISGFFIDPEKYDSILSKKSGGGAINIDSSKQNTSEGAAQGLKLKTVDIPGNYEYQQEKMRLDSLKMQLTQEIDANPEIKAFKDKIILDTTSEGLRIQIVDDETGAMFESGSTELKDKTIQILKTLAKSINDVPNKISITGHTDAKPFNAAGSNKTNWELSAERANAARRLLVENGLEDGKVARVVGFGSTNMFDTAHPEAATNRRISIIVLRKETEQGITPKN